MQLRQPRGLRRGPDTDAFYALDDEAKWAPSHGRQVKQKKETGAIGLAGLERNPARLRQPPLCNSGHQTKD